MIVIRLGLSGSSAALHVGKVGFADFNGDGKLDFITPVDRVDALVKDQFVIFLRK